VIDGLFVINPVVHAYNLTDANLRSPRYGPAFRQTLWALHSVWNPPELQMPQAVYFSDWPVEVLADTLFLETSVDLAGHHRLRLDSWFHDGLVAHEKNVAIRERWPQRFVIYVGVDPIAGLSRCLEEMDRQLADLPGAIGLKLYPDQVDPLRSWRMDDPTLAFPLFEAAIARGIRTVAIHKAIPNGPVPLDPYRVGDVDGAAAAFPDLSFEIVHSGLAFVEETALAISRFPNVYANLEITTLLLHRAPQLFEEALAKFVMWGGPSKVIWSDGSLFCHSQLLLEKFMAFDWSEATREKYRLGPLTKQDKALILGQNYARITGMDIAALQRAQAGDVFERRRAEEGMHPPYSNWRRAAGVRGETR